MRWTRRWRHPCAWRWSPTSTAAATVEGQERLLDALTRQSPDAVLLAGDILDDEMPPAPALQFLSEAAQRWPCVYVSGNHEVWTGRLPEDPLHIETLGVHVLQGERLTLTLREASIDLLGLDDPAVGTSLYGRELDALATLPETGHFSVLLAHRPRRCRTTLLSAAISS